MSTTSRNINSSSKFTKGEKCIFVHVVITFCAIIAIVIGYYGHACLVQVHTGGILGISLRSHPEHSVGSVEDAPYGCVGAVYVRDRAEEGGEYRMACGAVLLDATWSLVTARCVVVRSRPSLSHLLPYWTLRYENNSTGILRGVSHPQYDDEDLNCDVGLFEHESPIILFMAPLTPCSVPSETVEDETRSISDIDDLYVVGWHKQGWRSVTQVRGLTAAKCSEYTSPVAEQPLRVHTLCVAARSEPSDTTSLLGGVLFASSRMFGVSSWGYGDNSFPLIVVDTAHYTHWLQSTMSEQVPVE